MKIIKGTGLKVVASFLIFAMLSQEPLFATGEIGVRPALSLPSPVKTDSLTALPRKWGKIQKVFKGSSPLFLIHIQDAHLNTEAQHNIARVIDYFAAKTKLTHVYLEGASGELSHRPLSIYPDVKAKRLVAEAFLRDGLLTGPEYVAVVRRPELVLYGIEEKELYEKNRQAFLQGLEFQARNKPLLNLLKERAEKLGRFVFSETLRQFVREREAFHEDPATVASYVDFLLKHTEEESISENYPQLSKLREIQKTKDQNPEQWKKLGEELSLSLFEEISALEGVLEKSLVTTEEEKTLLQIFHALEILEKIMDFSMTHEDAEDFYSHRAEYDVVAIHEKLLELSKQYHFASGPVLSLERFNSDLSGFEKFYQLALERDKVLIDRTLADLEKKGASSGVLVTGGFHTPKIEAYLEKKGISYCVITPRMAQAPDPHDKDRYIEAMRFETSPFFHKLQEVIKHQQVFANDPRFQLQPPSRLPSLSLLQTVSASPKGIPLPRLVEDFPGLDTVVQGMFLLSGKSIALGGTHPEYAEQVRSQLRPEENFLTNQVYSWMNSPQTLFRQRGQSGAILTEFSEDNGFAVQMKWEQQRRPPEWHTSRSNREMFLNTPSDRTTMTVQLLQEPAQYEIARKKLTQIPVEAPKRSELRKAEAPAPTIPSVLSKPETAEEKVLEKTAVEQTVEKIEEPEIETEQPSNIFARNLPEIMGVAAGLFIFGFTVPAFLLGFAAALVFRGNYIASMLLHEWSHLVAGISSNGKEILNWKNILGNRSLSEWLRGSLFSGHLPAITHVKIPKSTPQIENAGWIANVAFFGIVAVGFGISTALMLSPATHLFAVAVLLMTGWGALKAVASDLLFPAAIEGVFGCGIFWITIKRLMSESDDAYLERVLTILERLANFMSLFGSHGIGAALQVEYPDGRIDYIDFKIPYGYGQNPLLYERIGRVEFVRQFMGEFRAKIAQARRRGARLRKMHVSLSGHVRLKTSGGEIKWNTTQPFRIPGYVVRKWRNVDGNMVVSEEQAVSYSAANGDTNKARLPGHTGGLFFDSNASDSPWGKFFARAYNLPIGDNDSEEAAYFMHFLRTEGSLADSLRLSYVSNFFQSLDDALPSWSKLQQWDKTLEPIILEYGPLDWTQPGTMKRILEQAERLLPQSHVAPQVSSEEYLSFLEYALKAFKENNAKRAAQIFMSMVDEHSTFGLFYESSLDPDIRVVISREQPVSVVENVAQGVQMGGSNLDFLKWAMRGGDPAYRQGDELRELNLRMDKEQPDRGGEIAEINFREGTFEIYSMNAERQLTKKEIEGSEEEEIKGRWRDITNEPPEWNPPQIAQDPMENDLGISLPVSQLLHQESKISSLKESPTLQARRKFLRRWRKGALQLERINQVLQKEGIQVPVKHGAPDLFIVVFREDNIAIGEWFKEIMHTSFPLANIQVVNANSYIHSIEAHPLYLNTNTVFLGDHFPQERIGEEHARRVKFDDEEKPKKMTAKETGKKLSETEASWKVLEMLHDRKPPHAFVLTPTAENNISRSLAAGYGNVISTKYFSEVDGSTGGAWAQMVSLMELYMDLVKDMRLKFPKGAPFGMTLSGRDIAGLNVNYNYMLTEGLKDVLGLDYDANGEIVKKETQTHKNLIGLSQQLQPYFTEQARATALTIGHLFITLAFTSSAIQIGVGILLIGVGGVGTIPGILLSFFSHLLFDFPLYMWFKYMAVRWLRLQEGREGLHRDANPTLVIGDNEWSRFIRMTLSKMFGLAKAIISPQAIYSAKEYEDLEGKHGHDARRGTIVILSMPPEMKWNDYVNAAHSGIKLLKNQVESFASIKAVGPMLVGIVDDADPERFKFVHVASIFSEKRTKLQSKERFDNTEAAGKLLELMINGPLRMMAHQVVFVDLVKGIQNIQVGYPLSWQSSANQNGWKATTTDPIRPPKSIWDKGRILVNRSRRFLGTPLDEALKQDIAFLNRTGKEKVSPASQNGHATEKSSPAKLNGDAHSTEHTVEVVEKPWGFVLKPNGSHEKETVSSKRSESRSGKWKPVFESLEDRKVLDAAATSHVFSTNPNVIVDTIHLAPQVDLPATDSFFDQLAGQTVRANGDETVTLDSTGHITEIRLTYSTSEGNFSAILTDFKPTANPASFTWIQMENGKQETSILRARLLDFNAEGRPQQAYALNERTGVSLHFEFSYPEKVAGSGVGILKKVEIKNENGHSVIVTVDEGKISYQTREEAPDEPQIEKPVEQNAGSDDNGSSSVVEETKTSPGGPPPSLKLVITGAGGGQKEQGLGIQPKDLRELLEEERKIADNNTVSAKDSQFVSTENAADEEEAQETAEETEEVAGKTQMAVQEAVVEAEQPAVETPQSAPLIVSNQETTQAYAGVLIGAGLAGAALYQAAQAKKEKTATAIYWTGLSVFLGGGLIAISVTSPVSLIVAIPVAAGLFAIAYFGEKSLKKESSEIAAPVVSVPVPSAEEKKPTLHLSLDAETLTLEFPPNSEEGLRNPDGRHIYKIAFRAASDGYHIEDKIMTAVADPHTDTVYFSSNNNGDGYHLEPDNIPANFGMRAPSALVQRMRERTPESRVPSTMIPVSTRVLPLRQAAPPQPQTQTLPRPSFDGKKIKILKFVPAVLMSAGAAILALIIWRFLPTVPLPNLAEAFSRLRLFFGEASSSWTSIFFWGGLTTLTLSILFQVRSQFSSLFTSQTPQSVWVTRTKVFITYSAILGTVLTLLGVLPLAAGWASLLFMNSVLWLVVGGLAVGMLGPLVAWKILSKITGWWFTGNSAFSKFSRKMIAGAGTVLLMATGSIGVYFSFFASLDKNEDPEKLLDGVIKHFEPIPDWAPSALPEPVSIPVISPTPSGTTEEPNKPEFKNLNSLLYEADTTGISIPIQAQKEGQVELDPNSGISLEDWLNPDKAIRVIGGQPLLILNRPILEAGASGRNRVGDFKKYVFDRLQDGKIYRQDSKAGQPLRSRRDMLYDKAGFLIRQVDNYQDMQNVEVYKFIRVPLPEGEEGWILPGIRQLGTVNADTQLAVTRSVHQNAVKIEIPMVTWQGYDVLKAQIEAGIPGQKKNPARSIVLIEEMRLDGKVILTEAIQSTGKVFDWDPANNRPYPLNIKLDLPKRPENTPAHQYLSEPLASPYITVGKREEVEVKPTGEIGRTKFNVAEATWVAPSPSQKTEEKKPAQPGTTLQEKLFPYQTNITTQKNPDVIAEVQDSDRTRLKALAQANQEFQGELLAFTKMLDQAVANQVAPFAPAEAEKFADDVVRIRQLLKTEEFMQYKAPATGIVRGTFASVGKPTVIGQPIAYVGTRRMKETTHRISKNIPVQPGDIAILDIPAAQNEWMPVRVRNVVTSLADESRGEFQGNMQEVTLDILNIPKPVNLKVKIGEKEVAFRLPGMWLAEGQFGVRINYQPAKDQPILQELYRQREAAAAGIFAQSNLHSLPPLPGIVRFEAPASAIDQNVLIGKMEKPSATAARAFPEETPIEVKAPLANDTPEIKRLLTESNPDSRREVMRNFLASSRFSESQKINLIKTRLILNAPLDVAQMGLDYLRQKRNIEELLNVHAILTEKTPTHELTKRARRFAIELIESGSHSLLTGPSDNLLENLTLDANLESGRKFAASILAMDNAAFHPRYAVSVRRILSSKFWKTYQQQLQLARSLEKIPGKEKSGNLVRNYVFSRIVEHISFQHQETLVHAKDAGAVMRRDPKMWAHLLDIEENEKEDRAYTQTPDALSYETPEIHFQGIINEKVYKEALAEYEQLNKELSEATAPDLEIFHFSADQDLLTQDFIFGRLDRVTQRDYIQGNMGNPYLGLSSARARQRFLPVMLLSQDVRDKEYIEFALDQILMTRNDPDTQYLIAQILIEAKNPEVLRHLLENKADNLLIQRAIQLKEDPKTDHGVLEVFQHALAKLSSRPVVMRVLFDSLEDRELKQIADGRHWLNKVFDEIKFPKEVLKAFTYEQISRRAVMFAQEKVEERNSLPAEYESERRSSLPSQTENLANALEPHHFNGAEAKSILNQEPEKPKNVFEYLDIKPDALRAYFADLRQTSMKNPSQRRVVGLFEGFRLLIATLGIAMSVVLGAMWGIFRNINPRRQGNWLSRLFVAGVISIPVSLMESSTEAALVPVVSKEIASLPAVKAEVKPVRSELRKAKMPQGLKEALKAKTNFQREAALEKQIPFAALEEQARRENWNLLEVMSRFSSLDAPYRNWTRGFSPTGEIVFVYRPEDHSPAFIRKFLKDVKTQKQIRRVTFMRDLGVSEQDWEAFQAQVKSFTLRPDLQAAFTDGIGSGVLHGIVQSRIRALGLSWTQVVQLSDGSERNPDQRKYFQALMVGAVPIANSTVVVLGRFEILPQVRELKIEEILNAIINFQARKILQASA